jgi:hypothetical protein
MKTLKFYPNLCVQILSGEKTVTWRIHDDKDLQVNDEIQFVNRETKTVFGVGTIAHTQIKTLGTLEKSDWEGHERFASEEEMYATYRFYYGDTVGPPTEVKRINFSFKAL